MLSFKFTSLWPNTEDALHRSPLFSWSIFELLSALPQPHTLTDTACLPLEVRNVLWLSAIATPSKNSWASNGTHSSPLAWKIPWMEEPGGLQSMGLLRVRHDWATSLSLFTFMHWRRKWQPTPVFLPGESQGWGSLVGCCLWGRTESDTTEVT